MAVSDVRSDEEQVVRYEAVSDHVVCVTLDRPAKRNAVNGAMARQLEAAVQRAEGDRAVRAVVLASSHPGTFCAGADLGEIAAGRGREASTEAGGFAGFVYQPRAKPWIAAAAGSVVAGGLELCLACDMIVAGEGSLFGLPEVKRGLVAGAGGLDRLARALPRALALEMIATGEPIDAARAHAAGLVNRVVPPAEVRAAAIALAGTIAANAPLAVQAALAVTRGGSAMSDAEGRAAALVALDAIRHSADFKEGPRAFAEKRAPVWTGL